MLWNPEVERILFIDFERAKLCNERPAPLGVVSLNRSRNAKRNRNGDSAQGETNKLHHRAAVGVDKFDSELREMLKYTRT